MRLLSGLPANTRAGRCRSAWCWRGNQISGVTRGPFKIHLHEARFPEFDAVVASIQAAHGQGRVVAVHCVTLAELVFTLAALREAGVMAGDRIEHASVTPDEQLREIAGLGLAVVVQPNFVAERGDAYLADIPPEDWPYLYCLRAFREAGVVMAGGSDTPFGAAALAPRWRRRFHAEPGGGRYLGRTRRLRRRRHWTCFWLILLSWDGCVTSRWDRRQIYVYWLSHGRRRGSFCLPISSESHSLMGV
jgi:hypothetical protein